MFIRITSGVLKSCWRIVILCVVLVAIYLMLGRLFVYSVTANKEQIESVLHERGLQNIELAGVRGEWQVFDPVFELTDVRLRREGEIALSVDRLKLRLNSWQSLFRRTAIVSDMEVSGVRFTLLSDEDGVRIKGFPRGDGEFNLQPILDSVPYLEILELTDIDITLLGRDHQLQLTSHEGEPWVVRADGKNKQISFPLYLERDFPDGSTHRSRLNLTGSYRGDLRKSNFSTNLYLIAPQIDLANFLPEIDISGQRFSSATLTTEIWLRISPEEVDVIGDIEVTDISLSGDGESVPVVDQLVTQFRFLGTSFSEGQLSIPGFYISQDQYEFEVSDLSVAFGSVEGVSSLAGDIPSVDVSTLVGLIEFAGEKSLIPERLSSGLSAVSPRGTLSDIAFSLNLKGGNPRLAGNLKDFAMDAYLGVPAIDQLNGFLYLQPERGYLDIDNDVFQLDFSNMFSSPWPFDSGRGRIAYEVEEGQFRVSSGLIELVAGELEAYGKLTLNLPSVRDDQTWGLTLGISDAELLEARRYTPNTIPPDLVDWIDSAILGGRGVETGLTFHGALYRGSPKVRKTHDLYFKVEKTRMKYHADWPSIDNAVGTVHINNHFVRSARITGRVYDSDILTASVNVPLDSAGQAHTVLVDAKAAGPFSDIVRALNETPLAETTSNMASLWQASGSMEASMSINVPVGIRQGEDVVTEVNVQFRDSTLDMPEFDLVVDSLEGSADYSTVSGLNSAGFQGVSFDEPIQGQIHTELHGDGGEIEVSVTGRIAAEALYQWSDQVLLSRADGSVKYQASVHVPYGGDRDESYVVAHSDLVGMTLNLPAPMAKTDPAASHEFSYSQFFHGSGFKVDMSLDETIRASLKIEDGLAVGGRVHFGTEPFGAVTYDRIRMTGHLTHLNYEEWMATTDELAALTDVSLEDEIAAHVESAELLIDELLLFSLPLEQAEVRVTRDEKAWLAHIENEMLLGDVTVSDDDLLPIDIRLQRLSFEGEEDGVDPLGDVDPVTIGAIDFSTQQLEIDGEDYGSWAFNYRTTEDTATFENLTARAAGLLVLPSSRLEWSTPGGQHDTRFKGDVQIDDLASALKKFGFASSIEGKDLKVNADIRWAGSPATVDVDRVVGKVGIEEGEGRFVQAETGGALKLLGIFDFASLARRFRLDFSDVVDKGFEFSDISGVTEFNEGLVRVIDPIVIEGSSGTFTVGGTVNLETSALDNEMIVTLPVGRTLPWYAAYSAIATGPLAGAGVMLAQKVFESQIDQMSSAKYKITGTMEEPNIEFVAIFDDKVAKAKAEQP